MKQEIVQLRKDVKVDGYSKNRVIFPGGPSWNKMREILPKLVSSYLFIWFVFYASLHN